MEPDILNVVNGTWNLIYWMLSMVHGTCWYVFKGGWEI